MNLDFTPTEIAIALAAGVVVACWVLLIVAPAWRCYGRVWEKLAATFLTLFILGTLVVFTFDACPAGSPADLLPSFCPAN